MPLLLLCTPLIMVGYQMAVHQYGWSEAVQAVKAYNQSRTKFQALKYSDRLFRSIEVGTTGKEVFELIGVPLEREMPEDKLWKYSVNEGSTGYYHERSLVMEKGIVKEVIYRFKTP